MEHIAGYCEEYSVCEKHNYCSGCLRAVCPLNRGNSATPVQFHATFSTVLPGAQGTPGSMKLRVKLDLVANLFNFNSPPICEGGGVFVWGSVCPLHTCI